MATTSRERGLVQASAALAILMGIGCAVWAILRAMADVPPPGPLTAGLLLCAATEIFLGAGLLRGSRAAWAFSLSLNSTMGMVGLFALPAISHTSTGRILTAVALAGVVGIVSMLVTAKNEFAR